MDSLSRLIYTDPQGEPGDPDPPPTLKYHKI